MKCNVVGASIDRVDATKEFDSIDNERLSKWVYPQYYYGNNYDGYYILYSINRDSEPLEDSNYETIIKMFKDSGIVVDESGADFMIEYCEDCNTEQDNRVNCIWEYCDKYPDVIVARAGHWAVGWVESIMVRGYCSPTVRDITLSICNKLSEYPILDEEDYSRRETEEEMGE